MRVFVGANRVLTRSQKRRRNNHTGQAGQAGPSKAPAMEQGEQQTLNTETKRAGTPAGPSNAPAMELGEQRTWNTEPKRAPIKRKKQPPFSSEAYVKRKRKHPRDPRTIKPKLRATIRASDIDELIQTLTGDEDEDEQLTPIEYKDISEVQTVKVENLSIESNADDQNEDPDTPLITEIMRDKSKKLILERILQQNNLTNLSQLGLNLTSPLTQNNMYKEIAKPEQTVISYAEYFDSREVPSTEANITPCGDTSHFKDINTTEEVQHDKNQMKEENLNENEPRNSIELPQDPGGHTDEFLNNSLEPLNTPYKQTSDIIFQETPRIALSHKASRVSKRLSFNETHDEPECESDIRDNKKTANNLTEHEESDNADDLLVENSDQAKLKSWSSAIDIKVNLGDHLMGSTQQNLCHEKNESNTELTINAADRQSVESPEKKGEKHLEKEMKSENEENQINLVSKILDFNETQDYPNHESENTDHEETASDFIEYDETASYIIKYNESENANKYDVEHSDQANQKSWSSAIDLNVNLGDHLMGLTQQNLCHDTNQSNTELTINAADRQLVELPEKMGEKHLEKGMKPENEENQINHVSKILDFNETRDYPNHESENRDNEERAINLAKYDESENAYDHHVEYSDQANQKSLLSGIDMKENRGDHLIDSTQQNLCRDENEFNTETTIKAASAIDMTENRGDYLIHSTQQNLCHDKNEFNTETTIKAASVIDMKENQGNHLIDSTQQNLCRDENEFNTETTIKAASAIDMTENRGDYLIHSTQQNLCHDKNEFNTETTIKTASAIDMKENRGDHLIDSTQQNLCHDKNEFNTETTIKETDSQSVELHEKKWGKNLEKERKPENGVNQIDNFFPKRLDFNETHDNSRCESENMDNEGTANNLTKHEESANNAEDHHVENSAQTNKKSSPSTIDIKVNYGDNLIGSTEQNLCHKKNKSKTVPTNIAADSQPAKLPEKKGEKHLEKERKLEYGVDEINHVSNKLDFKETHDDPRCESENRGSKESAKNLMKHEESGNNADDQLVENSAQDNQKRSPSTVNLKNKSKTVPTNKAADSQPAKSPGKNRKKHLEKERKPEYGVNEINHVSNKLNAKETHDDPRCESENRNSKESPKNLIKHESGNNLDDHHVENSAQDNQKRSPSTVNLKNKSKTVPTKKAADSQSAKSPGKNRKKHDKIERKPDNEQNPINHVSKRLDFNEKNKESNNAPKFESENWNNNKTPTNFTKQQESENADNHHVEHSDRANQKRWASAVDIEVNLGDHLMDLSQQNPCHDKNESNTEPIMKAGDSQSTKLPAKKRMKHEIERNPEIKEDPINHVSKRLELDETNGDPKCETENRDNKETINNFTQDAELKNNADDDCKNSAQTNKKSSPSTIDIGVNQGAHSIGSTQRNLCPEKNKFKTVPTRKAADSPSAKLPEMKKKKHDAVGRKPDNKNNPISHVSKTQDFNKKNNVPKSESKIWNNKAKNVTKREQSENAVNHHFENSDRANKKKSPSAVDIKVKLRDHLMGSTQHTLCREKNKSKTVPTRKAADSQSTILPEKERIKHDIERKPENKGNPIHVSKKLDFNEKNKESNNAPKFESENGNNNKIANNFTKQQESENADNHHVLNSDRANKKKSLSTVDVKVNLRDHLMDSTQQKLCDKKTEPRKKEADSQSTKLPEKKRIKHDIERKPENKENPINHVSKRLDFNEKNNMLGFANNTKYSNISKTQRVIQPSILPREEQSTQYEKNNVPKFESKNWNNNKTANNFTKQEEPGKADNHHVENSKPANRKGSPSAVDAKVNLGDHLMDSTQQKLCGKKNKFATEPRKKEAESQSVELPEKERKILVEKERKPDENSINNKINYKMTKAHISQNGDNNSVWNKSIGNPHCLRWNKSIGNQHCLSIAKSNKSPKSAIAENREVKSLQQQISMKTSLMAFENTDETSKQDGNKIKKELSYMLPLVPEIMVGQNMNQAEERQNSFYQRVICDLSLLQDDFFRGFGQETGGDKEGTSKSSSTPSVTVSSSGGAQENVRTQGTNSKSHNWSNKVSKVLDQFERKNEESSSSLGTNQKKVTETPDYDGCISIKEEEELDDLLLNAEENKQHKNSSVSRRCKFVHDQEDEELDFEKGDDDILDRFTISDQSDAALDIFTPSDGITSMDCSFEEENIEGIGNCEIKEKQNHLKILEMKKTFKTYSIEAEKEIDNSKNEMEHHRKRLRDNMEVNADDDNVSPQYRRCGTKKIRFSLPNTDQINNRCSSSPVFSTTSISPENSPLSSISSIELNGTDDITQMDEFQSINYKPEDLGESENLTISEENDGSTPEPGSSTMDQSTSTISDTAYHTVQEHLHKSVHENPTDDNNIEAFIADLKRKVNILDKATTKGSGFRKFLTLACLPYFLRGLCTLKNCPKLHAMGTNWTNLISSEDVWAIIALVLTSATQPPVSFFLSLLPWLDKLHSPSKVMMVSRYFLLIRDPFVCQMVFDSAVKAFMRCDFPKWKTIAGMLMLNYDPSCASVTDRFIYHLRLEEQRFQYYWEALELLTDTGYKLPLPIIENVLKDVCEQPRKDKKSMMKIYKLVADLEPSSLLKLEPLVTTFMSLTEDAPVKEVIEQNISFYKRAHKVEQNKRPSASSSSDIFHRRLFPENKTLNSKLSVVNNNRTTKSELRNLSCTTEGHPEIYEFDKMKAALIRGMECENYKAVANAIIRSSTTNFHRKLAVELLNLIMECCNGLERLSILFNEVSIGGTDIRPAKDLLAEVCITLMIKEAKENNWIDAYSYLNLVRENHINPIKIRALQYPFSELIIAVICSEVNFQTHHYNTAVSILINNRLLSDDSSKWTVKGTKNEFNLVKHMIDFLFFNFHEIKIVDLRLHLFKEILDSQRLLRIPINLIEYFEPLICTMFQESEKYARICVELYERIMLVRDSTQMQLSGLTYRTLVVLAVRGRFSNDLVNDLISKAIGTYAYPILEERKDTIMLHTCFLEEEMHAYLLYWLKWHGSRPVYHPFEIMFKKSSTNDFVEFKELPKPPLLYTVKFTLKEAFQRLQNVVTSLLGIPYMKLQLYPMRDETIRIPMEVVRMFHRVLNERFR